MLNSPLLLGNPVKYALSESEGCSPAFFVQLALQMEESIKELKGEPGRVLLNSPFLALLLPIFKSLKNVLGVGEWLRVCGFGGPVCSMRELFGKRN